MNIKKSIEMAVAIKETSNKDVAAALGITKQSLSRIKTKDNVTTNTLQSLADVFEMSMSEFIKLGE